MTPIATTFRSATPSDVFILMELYQKSKGSLPNDPLFLDYKKLQEAIVSPLSLWLITEVQGRIAAMGSVIFDKPQGMCKITRLLVDPECPAPRDVMLATLHHALSKTQEAIPEIECAYTTTLSLSLDMQEITLQQGFHITGVFPNALGSESGNLNGMTAYYFNNSERTKRYSDFRLHPQIQPFFEVVREQMNLDPLPVAETIPELKNIKYDPLPALELVRAPGFVSEKYNRLKEKHSQAVTFYPFYTPNTLITDAKGEIEIYVRISESLRFAAIIGEYLEKAVQPVELYNAVCKLLRNEGISYIEIINDAADLNGTDFILEAGFTPCAYVPAFKRQGDVRRDYVVFGRSFEYLMRPNLNIPRPYLEFFKAYFKIERKNYFRKLD